MPAPALLNSSCTTWGWEVSLSPAVVRKGDHPGLKAQLPEPVTFWLCCTGPPTSVSPGGEGWSSAVASRGSGCPNLHGPPPPPRGACCQDTGAQGPWLETLPWSGPLTCPLVHPEGSTQGVGTLCSSRLGRELLARQSGGPQATPRHGPTLQAAPRWRGSKEKNRQS